MPSNEHAQAAIAGLHGKELAGNMVKVNEAKQRE
jgi:RNA recognition motif-containing protein